MTFTCYCEVRLFLLEMINRLIYFYLLQRSEFHLNHEEIAPVAQLDRVLDYESRGRGFESSPVRHVNQRLSGNYAEPFVFWGNVCLKSRDKYLLNLFKSRELKTAYQ